MKGNRLSVEEVAPVLGRSPNWIREYMRRGELPIGKAVKTKKVNGKQKYHYDIYVPLVLEYTGLKEWKK